MSKPSWITPDKMGGTGNDTVTFTATANTGRNQRTGTITYSASGVAAVEQSIIQSGAEEFVRFNSQQFSITKDGGTLTVTGYSNSKLIRFAVTSGDTVTFATPINYKAAGLTSPILNDGSTQIPNDPGASAQYQFEVSFTVLENPTISDKTATLTAICHNTSKSASCTVKQSGADAFLTVSPNQMSFAAAGGSLSVSVSSNTNWAIS